MKLTRYATEIEDIQPGETIRLNHEDCTAGEDTRRRLYITRTLADPEVVVGYCHNCAEGGKYSDHTFTSFRNQRHEPMAVNTHVRKVYTVGAPKDLVTVLAQWPIHSQAWAMKNKLTQPDLDTYQIAHDTDSDRVYLPRYREVLSNIDRGGQNLEGYQLRLTRGKGPKYTTVVGPDDEGFTVLKEWTAPEKDMIVVVEDLVSGIHIMNAFKSWPDKGIEIAVLVNYGVKINPLAIPILNGYDVVKVWLDNDSPFVKDQAAKYSRTVALYGKAESYVMEEVSDPKHYEPEKIREVLLGQH